YVPAARFSAWLKEPLPWRKATWDPSGAFGLPAVKPLPLPEAPAEPANAQGGPAGAYWNAPNVPGPPPSDPDPAAPQVGGGTAASGTLSTKAVWPPRAVSRPWNVIVCAPAPTANAAVVNPVYAVPAGVNVPTATPSTRTWKSCRDAWKFPRCAAWNVTRYAPAARLVTLWLNDPLPWRKATWPRSGALGLPEVQPLP